MSALQIYVSFPGTARQALGFYADVFGGDLALYTYAEFNRSDGPPDAIAHGELSGAVALAGSDAAAGEKSVLSEPEGVVIACAPKGGPVMAIKAGREGDVTGSHVAWKSKDFSSDVCVPLFYKDKLYVLNGDGPKTLYRVDPATGKVETSLKLGGRPVFRASPTGADGKIYCMNERAEVWVVNTAGGKLETVNQVDLSGGSDADTRSSIALADGQVFVRTAETLYSFGGK